ncbi:methyltransferase domain-containing protein [Mesorhizobium sp. B2-1-3A]|nr:methyltransferase domain-containing protein [Mesorhizobium sp. B2-1-3A]
MVALSVLERCLLHALPPEVALARLAVNVGAEIDADELAGIAASLHTNDICQRAWLAQVAGMLADRPQILDAIRATAASVCHQSGSDEAPAKIIARLASGFDRASAVSPAASVQLSSLGEEEKLAAATYEIVDWLEQNGLTGGDKDILDIGCGIGRFESALHSKVGRVVGTDISPNMIAIARRRCAGIANVEFHRTTGFDLAAFDDAIFDCVLAVDSFPYLVLAGVAERHFLEVARVLKPEGLTAILNYSYRGSLALDRSDIMRLVGACGIQLIVDGETPFSRWDGTAFLLRRFSGT